MKCNNYQSYQDLLDEAKKLDVVELFNKTYNIGYDKGYDDAVDRLIKRT